MTGFGGVQGNAFSVCQEMSGTVLNVQPRYCNRAGLTGADGNELHLAGAVRGELEIAHLPSGDSRPALPSLS